MRVSAFFLIIAVSATACASIPVHTMWKLRNVDPLQLHPATIKAATRVPEGVNISRLSLTFDLTSDATDEAIKTSIELEPATYSGSAYLKRQEMAGYIVTTYQIGKDNHAALRSFQTKARNLKRTYRNNLDFNFGLSFAVCLKPDAEKPVEVPVTTYIKIDEKSDFLTLTKATDIMTYFPEEARDKGLPSCLYRKD